MENDSTPKTKPYVHYPYVENSYIFILGPPGCGKGTLCAIAADRLIGPLGQPYSHLSVGDHLRKLCLNPEAVLDDDNLDTRISRYREGDLEHADFYKICGDILENRLVPSNVLVPLLEHEMFYGGPAETIWLIDGFPRSMENALTFEQYNEKPERVIVIECERDVAETRYLERGREPADDMERFARRYDEYVRNMEDIRKHYGDLIQTVRIPFACCI
ncbi:hypothetical protein PG987_009680 [Apiospora arundinis]